MGENENTFNELEKVRILDVRRREIKRIALCIVVFVSIYAMTTPIMGAELNTIMMEATCKISAPGSTGTGFVIGKPNLKNPPKAFYTLVTAHHVFQKVKGDTVTLVLRQKQKNGTWKRIELTIIIRKNGKPLWKKHSNVDLAAIFISLPENVITTLLTTDILFDDNKLKEYELHPGSEVLCLGYPFGVEANPKGFPILRSGRIASYPLTPTKDIKTFLFDFTVFKGNSGGPVYFVQKDPTYGGIRHLGKTIYGILGVVVSEHNITEKIQELYEKKEKTTPLQLGVVIHAVFIKELIDSMGPPQN